jgi:hypothetical protein
LQAWENLAVLEEEKTHMESLLQLTVQWSLDTQQEEPAAQNYHKAAIFSAA